MSVPVHLLSHLEGEKRGSRDAHAVLEFSLYSVKCPNANLYPMCLEKCRHRQNYIVLLEADILTVRIEYVAVDGSIVTVICLINGKNEMV